MSVKSCSIKYLDKAYIGVSVRLTSGKGVVKFDNKPLTDVEITGYSSQGFSIFHKNLPKKFWLDFGQLPLRELIIDNGIIKDEITFVENIIRHETQFVKTDTEAYKNAKAEFELDKGLELLPPTKLKPGQKVISAQCKDSIELIFIGNLFSTSIEPVYPNSKNRDSWRYGSFKRCDYTKKPSWKVCEKDPKVLRRAYFLRATDGLSVDINKISSECKKFIDDKFGSLKQTHKNYEERLKLNKQKKEAAIRWYKDKNIDFLYEIVSYPLTNKYVKQLMPIGISKEYTNLEKNIDLFNSFENSDFYCKEGMEKELIHYINKYRYYDHLYIRDFYSSNKKTILADTEEFIKTYYEEV